MDFRWEGDAVPARSFAVDVEPEVLTWARRSSGMSRDDIASRLHIEVAEIVAWEVGSEQPTFTQVKRLAEAYKRSVATLLLPGVPAAVQLPTDFRTVESQHAHPLTRKTLLAVRRAERVQSLALELAEQMDVVLSPTVPSLSARRDPEREATVLRAALEDAAKPARPWRSKQEAYESWRERAEGLGVFVVQATLDRNECRAFALADPSAPLVLVNSVEYPAARSFSLIHELAHLGLHASALCDMLEPDPSTYPASSVEVFCNHVAGAVLVPSGLLLARPEVSKNRGSEWTDEVLEALATPFRVSKEVVLRRLLIHGRTSQRFYETKRAEWARAHDARDDFIPRVHPSKKPLNRNGLAFSTLVTQAQRSGVLSRFEAADYLGTKPKHMQGFESYVSAARMQKMSRA